MRQTFMVTSPAAELSLLTIEQLRAAAGIAVGVTTRDDELEILGQRISADIATACRVASDGAHPPTLRRETITETFWNGCREGEISLSRRFIGTVAVTETETLLLTGDFTIDREAGVLSRIVSGRSWAWAYGTLSVVYQAGFDTIPSDLVGAAMDLARIRMSADANDPLEKGRTVEIPDVRTVRVDRWVGSVPGSTAGPVPMEVAAKLTRYLNGPMVA